MTNAQFSYQFTADISNLIQGINAAIAAITTLTTSTDALTNSFTKTQTQATATKDKVVSVSEGFAKLGAAITNTSKITQNFSAVTDLARGVLQTFVASSLGDFFQKAVNSSTSLIENMNLFRVAVGEDLPVMDKWLDQLSEASQYDPSNLARATGTYREISDAMGMPAAQADMVAKGLTSLSVDTSSFFNKDQAQVATSFQAAIVGLTKPVRQYGMAVSLSALQQEAEILGLKKKVTTMSEADKIGLRYIRMMKNAGIQHGDFARTVESPGNQLRILQNQILLFTRAIGDMLMPTLQRVLPYINGFMMAMTKVANILAAAFGYVMPEFEVPLNTASTAADDAAAAVDGLNSEINKLTAGFDELNVLSAGGITSSAGLFDMDPKIAAEMAQFKTDLDEVKMRAQEISLEILNWLGFFQDINGNWKWNKDLAPWWLQDLVDLIKWVGENWRMLLVLVAAWKLITTAWAVVQWVADIKKSLFLLNGAFVATGNAGVAGAGVANGAFATLLATLTAIAAYAIIAIEVSYIIGMVWKMFDADNAADMAIQNNIDSLISGIQALQTARVTAVKAKKSTTNIDEQIVDFKARLSVAQATPTMSRVSGSDILSGLGTFASDPIGVFYNLLNPAKGATGGAVSKPTQALIGEGKYDEILLPVGGSPQEADLVNAIAKAIGKQNNGNGNVTVTVKIGDKDWNAFVYQSSQKGRQLVGAQPIQGGAFSV